MDFVRDNYKQFHFCFEATNVVLSLGTEKDGEPAAHLNQTDLLRLKINSEKMQTIPTLFTIMI